MPVRLYLAPAAAGKTTYVLDLVRSTARGLQSIPHVCLPTHLQLRSWRRRLAQAGGAIGVRLLTFDQLYSECLDAAGEVYAGLSEPVQYRLLRAIVDDLSLCHYAPLTDQVGFVQVLQRLIGELKAGRIWPEALADAVAGLGDEPRLRELALIYTTYQERLQTHGWADRAGLGWLAVESLEERAPDVARDWPLLVVDGFDSFTPVQLALLKVLARRVGDLLITLNGTIDGSERRFVQRRFESTRQRLEQALGVVAAPLPGPVSHQAPALAHLEANLYRSEATRIDAGGAIEFSEAPDRAGEVRTALRWLKQRLLVDGMSPGQVALLARSIPPYRPFIQQTAAEFGLPICLVDGLPLAKNPAIATLLDMLRLMLPRDDGTTEPALPRRLVIEAWRSPYLDWSALPEENATEPIGIVLGDAVALDTVARWGRVVGGLSQWEEALTALAGRRPQCVSDRPDQARHPLSAPMDEERDMPVNVPVGPAAQALLGKFRRFVQRLTPPQDRWHYRGFVGWLEVLIGPDPALASPRYGTLDEPTSLQVVARARHVAATVPATLAVAERDVAALQALKDVLRGLVWAEEAVGPDRPVRFSRFFADLVGALEASTYHLPIHPEREEILVADVIQSRGVPFRAVALIGLAEGEFPATLSEDPFLRDVDRQRLRQHCALPLESSTESAEREFLYEALTRPRERLLLTRPRLTESGVPWQASPFWEEILRLVEVKPESQASDSVPPPTQAASWSEFIESMVCHPGYASVRDWVRREDPLRQAGLDAAAQLFRQRVSGRDGPFDGNLTALAGEFDQRFGPEHAWSASRLESYRTCPFLFFIGHVLGLEPREEPAEGLDARQLGSIYHRIFEELYQAAEVTDPSDLDQLLAALPLIAKRVLDQAPRREGFRETAWWEQTRQEIVQNVRRSLEALAELPGDFIPVTQEAGFFGPEALTMPGEEDHLRLHGIIDRVDQDSLGRLRIIDYKTSSPYSFTNQAVLKGDKLQLPLYARAARDALLLGEPVEGFYWHVRHAQASPFSLGKFKGGPEAALDVALEKAWEAVRGARSGHFVPDPPASGCPSYCPAAGFCWRYQRGY